MKNNTSPESKSNQLSDLLKESIENNGSKINKARLKLMSMVIIALCKVQTVSFHKLAIALLIVMSIPL